ncbi:hypothetical protein [Geomonas anaerohicana]|uniref:Uncharacterized protein n=1 Tax=Geomonas anaerohicana TaxID=2798583 RepID=A0ABS0YGC1_9BACT|nr:hypothetical protein [Geomonas anaerohicana]MBJ6751350.1 hypothetical protein [Geomonas anaerohicana]
MNMDRDTQEALDALSLTARKKVIHAAQDMLALKLHQVKINLRRPNYPAFNDEVYNRLRPDFSRMWSEIQRSNYVGNKSAQTFATQLVEKYGPSIKPYALTFYKELLETKRR